MNARTIRRAAERKARKLALKADRQHETFQGPRPELTNEASVGQTVVPDTTSQRSVSAARLDANRANATLSSGPKTEAGRKRSSLNAVKTALTGRTVLLPTDDVDRYEALVADWQAELKPEGPRESALVQSIADSYWRTERILRLEYALYAAGREQFADEFAHLSTGEAAARIEAKTYLAHEKQLRNLAIQEARLRRQREKDLAELKELQTERRAEPVAEKKPGQKKAAAAPQADGFVFANAKSPEFMPPASDPNTTKTTLKEDQTLRQVA